jgi:hypothetical protein
MSKQMVADNNHRLLYFVYIFYSIKQKMDTLKKTNIKWTDHVSCGIATLGIWNMQFIKSISQKCLGTDLKTDV